MKRCPTCARIYTDETQNFCLDDGAWLIDESVTPEQTTAIFPLEGIDPNEPKTLTFSSDPDAMTLSMSGYKPLSIAVLPFVHLSNDADDEYFCDGLAEELINALSRVDDLKVVARTSAFSFKGKRVDVAQIGSILKVNNVVEGSVRKSGDRMRISVQLISTEDGYNVWSEKYDTQMTDIFDVQDEITLSVVSALKAKLLGTSEANRKMSDLIEELKHHANDVEAYQLYLRGRYFFNKSTVDDYYRALGCFQKAIEIDPAFAAAHAGVADVHIWLTELGPVPPRIGMPLAREAALKAIAIDPDLSEAHTALALVFQEFDYDFAQAEAEYRLALDLNPNNTMAGQLYGGFLSQLGRFCEAEPRFRKAADLDPLSLVNWLYPFGLFMARKYDESIGRLQSILDLDPNVPAAVLILSFNHHMKQNFAAYVETYTRFLDLCGLSDAAAIGRSAFEKDEWTGFLRAMTAPDAQLGTTSYITAVHFAALGESETAITHLQESFNKREGHVVMLNVDPRFDSIRSDARFRRIIQTVGFSV